MTKHLLWIAIVATMTGTSAPTAASEADAAVPSNGCGSSTIGAGRHAGSMPVGELERSWVLQVPSGHDGETPLPLVMLLHGGWSWPDDILSYTGFPGLGERGDFIVVAPQARSVVPEAQAAGDPSYWMWELDSADVDLTTTNPDIAFAAALIDRMADLLCVDLARVYTTGESQGGGGASALACGLDDRLAAVASVGQTADFRTSCGQERPVPFLAFHGLDDDVVLVDGGFADWLLEAPLPDGSRTGDLGFWDSPWWWMSVPERVANIAERNGCEPDPTAEMIAPEVEQLSWSCPTDAQVRLVLLDEHGHSWPGSAEQRDYGLLTSMEIDATEMIWEFLSQHALPNQ